MALTPVRKGDPTGGAVAPPFLPLTSCPNSSSLVMSHDIIPSHTALETELFMSSPCMTCMIVGSSSRVSKTLGISSRRMDLSVAGGTTAREEENDSRISLYWGEEPSDAGDLYTFRQDMPHSTYLASRDFSADVKL